jgi:hypothetical protein
MDKMDKEFSEKIGEMMKIMFEISECSKKNCSAEKNKMMANKKTAELYNKYNRETNHENKIKLLNQIYKNNLIYKYNKCVVKHCKKIFNDYINFFRSFISIIPDSNSKRAKLENMITEIEKIFINDNLSKSQYKIYTKNIAELMSSITSS